MLSYCPDGVIKLIIKGGEDMEEKKIMVIVHPTNFYKQKGAITAALQEIDLDSPESLEEFIYRMGELEVVGIIRI
jgi:hypothetical protein